MGHASGTSNARCCCDEGFGVEKYKHKVIIYYQKSAMRHASGTYNVGYCYDEGNRVKKDERKSIACYQESSKMGAR